MKKRVAIMLVYAVQSYAREDVVEPERRVIDVMCHCENPTNDIKPSQYTYVIGGEGYLPQDLLTDPKKYDQKTAEDVWGACFNVCPGDVPENVRKVCVGTQCTTKNPIIARSMRMIGKSPATGFSGQKKSIFGK